MIEQIERRALAVFGDPDKARRWLTKPKRQLGGLTPLAAAEASPEGAVAVLELLERIDRGHFA